MPREFLLGVLAGVCVFVTFFLGGVAGVGELTYMGQSDERVADLILGRYAGNVLQFQLFLLALHGLLGALLGACAHTMRRALSGRRRPRSQLVLGMLADGVLVLLIHFCILGWGIQRHPAAYAEWLYEQGGGRSKLQIFLTDSLQPWLLPAVLVFMGALVVRGLFLRLGDLSAQPSRWRKLGLPGVGGLLAGAVAGMIAVGGGAQAIPTRGADGATRPHVLIIGVDSLRSDRLEDGGPAPRMAAFARQGTRFERMLVPVARTFPSWVSLLTGLLPTSHGVRHMFPRPEVLDSVPKALPAHLAEQGYRTGVVGDYAADIFSRWQPGFEVRRVPSFDLQTITRIRGLGIHGQLTPYLDTLWARRRVPDLKALADFSAPDALAREALATFDAMAATGGPVFLTTFFSGAHFPYVAAQPFRGTRTDPGYRGPFRYRYNPSFDSDSPLEPSDVEQVRHLYDEAVGATDAAVGELLRGLEIRGVLDDTLVVLLSDHGEELHEEAPGFEHGAHLRGDSVLQVPAVLVGPGIPEDGVVKGLTRSVDLAPTLADLVAAPPLPGERDGVSLSAQILEGKESPKLSAYAETGLWMRPEGERFYQQDRIRYPGVTELLEPLEDGSFSVKRELEDRVVLAKHRMAEDHRGRLIMVPTEEGGREEWYPAEGGPKDSPADLRALLATTIKKDQSRRVLEPSVDKPAAPVPPPARLPSKDLTVHRRLMDDLDQATLDIPNLDSAFARLRGYRRWMYDPWGPARGPKRVGLVFGHKPDPELDYYANRRAVYLPAPASISWQVQVPPKAKLSFGYLVPRGLPALRGSAVGFQVEVRPTGKPAAKSQQIFEAQVRKRRQKGALSWEDTEVDLSAFAGQEVSLTFKTRVLSKKRKRKRKKRRKKRRARPAHAFISAPTILGPAKVDTPPWNLLVIQVDALRAKDVGAYGGYGQLTPTIDALARSGMNFSRAITNHTWTRPSTLALLTGQSSDELGVNRHTIKLPVSERRQFYGQRPNLLPLRLGRSGYLVDAAINNLFMLGSHSLGLDFGFQRMVDFRHLVKDTPQVTGAAVDFIEKNMGHRWFLFVNLNAPHMPYTAPRRYRKMVRKRLPEAKKYPKARQRYLAELLYTDEHIAKILDSVSRSSQRERTLVVLTADHGEIMDPAHDRLSAIRDKRSLYHHGITAFDEEVHVPLIFSLPGVIEAGKTVEQQVQTLDVAPTLLELLGLEPEPRHRGRSLASTLLRGEALPERPVRIVGRFFRALREPGFKYVRHEKEVDGVWKPIGKEELYDLRADPEEHHNLVKKNPPDLERLRELFEAMEVAAAKPVERPPLPEGEQPKAPQELHLDVKVDPEVRRLLKKWGYL